MKIGILRETKIPADIRVAMSPKQCSVFMREYPGIKIMVQPGNNRCFTDLEFQGEGIEVSENLSDCHVMLGVKEVKPETLIPGKTYFFFSHTIKKQEHSRNLLQEIIRRKIRLVDYEVLTNNHGSRIIGFGRWAGLVGSYLALRAACIRKGHKQLPSPETILNLEDMMKKASNTRVPPMKIALTGDGRVAGGSEEMLKAFGITRVAMEDYLAVSRFKYPVYVQLDPEKYNKHIQGESFNLKHFYQFPSAYESNFYRFCDKTDLLIMAAYWDPKAPRLFTADQMKSAFRIRIIADITCDLNGSLPTTIRTTSFSEPYYDINPLTGSEEVAFSSPDNITVMAIDNLPCGLPREASEDFGRHLMRNVLPLLLQEKHDGIIGRATIAENGKLTKRFSYLADWIGQNI